MAAGRNPFQGGDVMSSKDSFSIVVFGASGDLAKKKTYPAIFELFSQGLLPSRMRIMGYARSSKTDEDFRESLRVYIKSSDSARVEAFLAMCYYRNGSGYDDEEGFATAIAEMHELEQADGPGESAGSPPGPSSAANARPWRGLPGGWRSPSCGVCEPVPSHPPHPTRSPLLLAALVEPPDP